MCRGTGFYINIPEAENYVILTAGHNLIDTNRELSQDLVVGGPPEGGLSVRGKGLKIFISTSYKVTPNHSNAENDYGAILIPKEDNSNPRGFGFALKLGHDNLRGYGLDVSGYQPYPGPGPVTSTGQCIGCWENQLEYNVPTQEGLSGSPVFIPYEGHETAVAIQ